MLSTNLITSYTTSTENKCKYAEKTTTHHERKR